MKKNKKAKTIMRSTRNLARFFHYHEGEGRERAIKIGASFLICLSLLVIAGASQVEKAFAERSYFLSMLLPELAEPAVAYEDETVVLAMENGSGTASGTEAVPAAPVEVVPSTPAQPVPSSPSSNPTPAPQPGPAPAPESTPAPHPVPVPEMRENGESEPNEEWERQNVMQDRNNVLREMRDQKRELRRVCAQLQRLKNAVTDLTACNELLATVVAAEAKIKAWNGTEIQELRDLIDDHRELQVWEQMEMLRLKANLPRELNDFFRSLTRLEKLLKQKSFQKIPGLNFEAINTKLAAMKALHAGAKACYDAGDLECAAEKLNEAREDGWPGELEGPLHNLRGIHEMLRQIRNEEVKTEIQTLLQPAIESINAGDWREGREEIESYHNEVNLFLQYIIRGQQKRKGGPNDTLKRLEKLIEKHGGENGGNGDGNDHGAEPERR